jgi:Glyoxalase superfamily protein
MRDLRDAKAMARSLRGALKTKAIETRHTEALELIAKALGYENWNILSAKIEEASGFNRRDVTQLYCSPACRLRAQHAAS